MSNDPRTRNEEKQTTPETIAPAKVSLRKFNRMAKRTYRQWLDARRLRTWCIKIPEAISEGEEKEYKFQEQQEAASAEAERWEKKIGAERQQKVQEKYQRLKHEREPQQKKTRTKTSEEEKKYRMMMTTL